MASFRTVLLHIDPAICRACERCMAIKACRTKAIIQIDPGEVPYLETSRCHDCWACIQACPFGAITRRDKET